jgi:cytochrome P450
MPFAPSPSDPRRVSADPRDPSFFQDPYAAYEAMRAVGPAVFWEQLGLWCLTGFDDVNAALRDRRLGREILHVATREEIGIPEPAEHLKPFYAVDDLSMLSREPPVHTRLRTLVNRAFVSRQIERLRPDVTALSHRLVDGMEEAGREADLITAFATPIPVAIIAGMMGVPLERTGDLLDWSHRMVAMYMPGRTRATEDAAVEATNAFVGFLRDVVADRRRAPGDDLISTLIAAEAAGDRLSEDELIAGVIQLLNAGHEATVHAIGNSVKAILQAGVETSGLADDPDRLTALAEESLRFDAPLHFFDRFVLDPVTIAGSDFRKGDKVGLLLGAANRDPSRWSSAGRFDPSRPLLAHAAFGAGIHFCIGAPLARLELEEALAVLFARLPGLRLAGAPVYRDSWHFHGLERLDVAW